MMVMVSERVDDLYRKHIDELIHFATVLVGPGDAHDVVADAVLATITSGSAETVDNVRAYWFRAVSNTASSFHRSRFSRLRREQNAFSSAATYGVDNEAVDARRVLATLSAQQRAVVYLTYWHDMSPDAVADLLQTTEGTVRKQLARARATLREALRHE